MRRRMMPAALVLVALLLDTAVIPFLTSSVYVVSVTFITVVELAMYLGRMNGMLYGMIGGLLIDIAVGYPLGFNTFLYIGLGFLAGTIAYEPVQQRMRRAPSRLYLRRWLTMMGVCLALEAVVFGYQYFNTAMLSGVYFANIFLRTLLAVAVGALLGPIEARIVLGRPVRYQRTSAKQEVKSF